MSVKNLLKRAQNYHKKLNGCSIEYDVSKYHNVVQEIRNLESRIELISDEQIKDKARKLQQNVRGGEKLDEILVEAFTLVSEAIKRTMSINPFTVQLIGGIVMHQGKLAEMKTGEGKTLAAVFPAYLNAMMGEGLHILTFNDYLARRDAEWMHPVYKFLGLSVGFVQEGMNIDGRKEAYKKDITYLTAKEAGFDFLRDSLCLSKDDIVTRNYNYAIIDEADSIMIDEARIPLIIAGTVNEESVGNYSTARLARKLEENKDFNFDDYLRIIHLTDSGLKRVEEELNCENIYSERNLHLLTKLNCALHAEYLLHREVDYIVRKGNVELVDEFTGRVADKRRWPDGLQEAIEAKENLNIKSGGKILNSISIQHFLQLYSKLSGMTATAEIAESEFKEFYNLDIVKIPQNKACIRKDDTDMVFKTKKSKELAIIEKITSEYKNQRPILVGTSSVAESINLSNFLKKQNIKCEVLNAKEDEYEAKIISKAGKLGAVTISTNMAGRGSDIILGGGDENEKKKILELGGLYVLGTNRYESRRIDNQLRGRAGRQGDPGESCFFISLEDNLFQKYKLIDLFPSKLLNSEKNDLIENKFIKKEINRVQRIIEGQNLEIKKSLYKYSFHIEQQRKLIAEIRVNFLTSNKPLKLLETNFLNKYEHFINALGKKELSRFLTEICLFQIDENWSNYLEQISDIRDSIHFRRLGGQEPIIEFNKISIDAFAALQIKIDDSILKVYENIEIGREDTELFLSGMKRPSSTWTYLVNDESFENVLGVGIIGNIGLSLGAGFLWPIAFLIPLIRKWRNNKFKKNDL